MINKSCLQNTLLKYELNQVDQIHSQILACILIKVILGKSEICSLQIIQQLLVYVCLFCKLNKKKTLLILCLLRTGLTGYYDKKLTFCYQARNKLSNLYINTKTQSEGTLRSVFYIYTYIFSIMYSILHRLCDNNIWV